MARGQAGGIAPSLQEAARKADSSLYVLRLYVAGITPHSSKAIRAVKSVCDEHLARRYDLQIVDIYQQPTLARGERIIAAPTFIKKLPLPLRRLIGSMADERKVLVGLDLRARND
jgi:circadian clock protein KaiB